MKRPVFDALQEVANNPNYSNLLIGYYMGSEQRTNDQYQNVSTLYKFRIKEMPAPAGMRTVGAHDETIGVWGSVKLNELLEKVVPGTLVAIQFVGIFPIKKYQEDWKNPENRLIIAAQSKNIYQEYKLNQDPNDRIPVQGPPVYQSQGNAAPLPPVAPPPAQQAQQQAPPATLDGAQQQAPPPQSQPAAQTQQPTGTTSWPPPSNPAPAQQQGWPPQTAQNPWPPQAQPGQPSVNPFENNPVVNGQ